MALRSTTLTAVIGFAHFYVYARVSTRYASRIGHLFRTNDDTVWCRRKPVGSETVCQC
jgi:hypothetical protein